METWMSATRAVRTVATVVMADVYRIEAVGGEGSRRREEDLADVAARLELAVSLGGIRERVT